jgi:hypothetical protein
MLRAVVRGLAPGWKSNPVKTPVSTAPPIRVRIATGKNRTPAALRNANVRDVTMAAVGHRLYEIRAAQHPARKPSNKRFRSSALLEWALVFALRYAR